MAVSSLKGLAVAAEATWSTFPTDQGAYARLPAEEITWKPEREFLARPVQSNAFGHKLPGVVGAKGGTLTFKVGLHGLRSNEIAFQPYEHDWIAPLMNGCGYTCIGGDERTTVSDDSTDPEYFTCPAAADLAINDSIVINGEQVTVDNIVVSSPTKTIRVLPALSALPKQGDSVRALAKGTTVTSGGGPTLLNVASAAGIGVGSVVVLRRDIDGVMTSEARLVTAVVDNAITINPGIDTTVDPTSASLYSSASYVLHGAQPLKSLAFQARGDGYNYIFSGCNGTVELETVTARGRPMLSFSFNVNEWTRDTSTTQWGLPELNLPGGIVARNSPFFWGDASDSARPVREAGFNPGLKIAPRLSTAASQGRSGWSYTDAEPVLTATAYRTSSHDDALHTDFEEANLRGFTLQLGSEPANMFVVAAPQAQLTSYPAEGDAEGLVSLPMQVGVCSAPDLESLVTLPLFTIAFC